jgi:hypothetical protein
MKKICTSNRIGTTARRGPGTRTAKAPTLHASNGKPNGIVLPATNLHPDNRRQPRTTRNPQTANASVLEDLASALDQVTAADHPRTFKLLQSSRHKVTRKLIEEACEVTVEPSSAIPPAWCAKAPTCSITWSSSGFTSASSQPKSGKR